MKRERRDSHKSEFDDFTAEAGSEERKPYRRRRNRHMRILTTWARIVVLCGAAGLLLTIAVAIVAKAIAPYQEASVMRSQLADTNRQIAEADSENAAYDRRLAYLHTAAGATSEARKLGYLKPGEVAVVVEGTPGQFNEAPIVAPPPASPTLAGRIGRLWRSLFHRP